MPAETIDITFRERAGLDEAQLNIVWNILAAPRVRIVLEDQDELLNDPPRFLASFISRSTQDALDWLNAALPPERVKITFFAIRG